MIKQNPRRVRRIAHLTDLHVMPEKGAPKGMEACIVHAMSQKDKADTIFFGGDLVMDSLCADKERTQAQWNVFLDVARANVTVPVRYAIGNHDVWGWGRPEVYRSEAKYGKVWVCELLELSKPYYSFDDAGWHFVVLDGTYPVAGEGYTARLDDEQFEWLKGDLAAVPKSTPIMVLSHIPIIAACAMFHGENEVGGNWSIPHAWVHVDARRIKDLFVGYPNIRFCASGHMHLRDQVVYNGITYSCNGAVSASWWNGDFQECTYGYSNIDLYDDGSFSCNYVPFGWKTQR